MTGGHDHVRFQRWMELDLLGKLPVRKRRRLHEHLRADEHARDHYDRLVEALRVLEGRDDHVQLEIDLVERWLFDDVAAPGEAGREPAWRWLWSAIGVLAVALLVVVLRGASSPALDDELAVRGGDRSAFALEAMCVAGEDEAAAVSAAADGTCGLGQTLTFAFRAPARPGVETPRWLSVFGVDAGGRVLYYAPAPDGNGAVRATAERWTPAPFSVRLEVNHRPGTVRVFGLLSPVAPDVDRIDTWAEVLRDRPQADVGDAPWHRRLTPDLLGGVCPQIDSCDGAELSFTLIEERP